MNTGVLVGTKVCNKCKVEKPLDCFTKSSKFLDGHLNRCAQCNQTYYLQNKEKILKKSKEYYNKNKEKILVKDKQYYIENKETLRTKHKTYYNENKEDILERSKQYSKTHRKEINARIRLYSKNREKIDPVYKINRRLSNAVYQSLLRRGGSKKGMSFFNCVGYTPKQLKEHLERLFSPSMTWENYGTTWEVHHIIPKAYFYFTTITDPQFKICWHLANLMPLNKEINNSMGRLIKDNKITKEQHIVESLKHLPLYKEVV